MNKYLHSSFYVMDWVNPEPMYGENNTCVRNTSKEMSTCSEIETLGQPKN